MVQTHRDPGKRNIKRPNFVRARADLTQSLASSSFCPQKERRTGQACLVFFLSIILDSYRFQFGSFPEFVVVSLGIPKRSLFSPTPRHLWTTSSLDLLPGASKVTFLCWFWHRFLWAPLDDPQQKRWRTADTAPLVGLVDHGHDTPRVSSSPGCRFCSSILLTGAAPYLWSPLPSSSEPLPLPLYAFWNDVCGQRSRRGSPWVPTAAHLRLLFTPFWVVPTFTLLFLIAGKELFS